MRKTLYLLVALALAVTIAGCASSEDPSDVYIGTWVIEGGESGIMYAEFRDDATFTKARTLEFLLDSDILWEYGTGTFDDEILRLITAVDSRHCRGIDASYRSEPSEDGSYIAHTLIEDACAGRAVGFKDMQRVE